MAPNEWLVLGREFGIFAVMVIYFVVQTTLREKRLGNRLTVVEEFAQKELVRLVAATTEALTHSAKALESTNEGLITLTNHVTGTGQQLSLLLSELRYRPCLIEQGRAKMEPENG